MQKIKLFILLILMMLLPVVSYAVTATSSASSELQARLQHLNGFYAKFTQQVSSPEGDILQQGSGEVWAQRPNLFDWKMEQPQQSQLMSNGTTVWMYEPSLAQVTCLSLDHFTQNALFLLILNNNAAAWQQFKIVQQGDLFTLTPLSDQSIKDYQITLSAKGKLSDFSVIEQDGQTNSYHFSAQRKMKLKPSRFNFTVPAGVTVDDQR